MDWRSCRFCKTSTFTENLVKYGERHYAYPECFLESGHKLEELHAWQVRGFPHRVLKKFGLLDSAPVKRASQEDAA